jgi:hypothetical protein
MRTLATAALLAAAAACAQSPATPTTVVAVATSSFGDFERGIYALSPGRALFRPGQSETFSAVFRQNFTRVTADVTWRVDDPAIATVDAAGRVTALKKGFTWLHADGADGTGAQPISVSDDPPIVATGGVQLVSCSAPFPQTCGYIMKGSGVVSAMSMTYRITGNHVVAETWFGNDKNVAAVLGTVEGSAFHFFDDAFLAPIEGAGGCCEALSKFSVSVSGSSVVSGGLTKSSGEVVLGYLVRIQ